MPMDARILSMEYGVGDGVKGRTQIFVDKIQHLTKTKIENTEGQSKKRTLSSLANK